MKVLHCDHRSLVDCRCRLRMYSRTADIPYRTARPILMKRGPVPLSRDLASHESDTPNSLATCAGCSRGSISFVFAGAFMGPTPFVPSGWMDDAGRAYAKRANSYAKFPSRSTIRLLTVRHRQSAALFIPLAAQGITVTLPKPVTSRTQGRKGVSASRTSATGLRRTFTIVRPVKGSPTTTRTRKMAWSYAAIGPTPVCAIRQSCTAGKERRITRWEHEHVLEAVQRRLDEHREQMRPRL